MDSADALLGGLASGDNEPLETPLAPIKREHDSTDDFEHLEKERQESGESPLHQHSAASQSFLDMEREHRAPSATDRFADQLADKFTDSESSDAGESPLHRAQQPAPIDATPALAPSISLEPKQPAPVKEPEPIAPLQPEPQPPKEAPKQRDPSPPPKQRDPSPPPKQRDPSPPPKQRDPSPPPKPKPSAPPVEPPKSAPVPEPVKVATPPPAAEKPPASPRQPLAHVIEAEVIFCQMGLDAWFDPQRLHPEVESLIYWRNVARSGAALGAGLVVLVALACCSVVSVLAYGSLLALSAAVAFRVYKNVLQAVQKTSEGHPFKWLLEQDISVPAERAQSVAAGATAHFNAAVNELRRLFLVEDLVDSLKFGVLLWCLTYVGACFNGITLIILGWVALFTLPKAYEMNKAQVDANLELARAKINDITAKVRAAVPLGRKSESEKDK